jgi:hypothetical protein
MEEAIQELFRSELEKAMNDLLKIELTSHLNYERYERSGLSESNSRNGSYERKLQTTHGELNLVIPRDRNGEFDSPLVPKYERRDIRTEELIIKLFQTGLTNSEISEIVESGKTINYHGPISKRGNPRVRCVLHSAVSTIVTVASKSQKDNPILQYYKKKRSEGKHHYAALTASATKLLRIIYTICVNDSTYKHSLYRIFSFRQYHHQIFERKSQLFECCLLIISITY